MKTVCIYHSIDLDGWMSAAIVKHWFKTTIEPKNKLLSSNHLFNTIEFIGYNYGQPIPDLSEYDKVIMCDISFPAKVMKDLHIKLTSIPKEPSNFIWLDHHISAITAMENEYPIGDSIPIAMPFGFRDTNYAACELTWKYFFPNDKMPEIVRLLGRYDCFGHKTKSFEMSSDGYDKAKQYLKEVGKLKEFEDNKTSTDGYSLVHYANDVAKLLSEEQKVLEFQYGARQCITDYETAYDYLVRSLDDKLYQSGQYFDNVLNQIYDSGKAIYKYLCTDAKQTYKNGFVIHFRNDIIRGNVTENGILKFICINKERFNPINFGINYHEDGYDGCMCFHMTSDKMISASLYNDNGEVDCSVIAKSFGGGGHKGAAGFRITLEQFNNLIK
jgi:oligoribonuclease NrnB/cAMP/cGMP phosphodiesterase (DHH superfamily)